MHWRSFFWGMVFGCCASHSAGCSDMGGIHFCRYKPGEAALTLEAPDGSLIEGSVSLNYNGYGSCVHRWHLDDGSQVLVTCEAGDPVTQCSVDGQCVDPSTDEFYPCKGVVEYQ